MTPIAILLFMCGVIVVIVGAGRAFFAARSLAASWFDGPDGHASATADQDAARKATRRAIRRSLPAAVWLGVSLYGLVLASVGMMLGR